MRPPPWRPRALQRLLLLILLVTAASCRRVSQPGPSAAAASGGDGGGGGGGHRLLLADTALPPADAEQVHRPFQLTLTTTIALVLSVLVAALSNAAGVGGGAIFVPLFNVLLSFSIKNATALSQSVITGGALGAVAYSISRRHPRDANRTLVDFDLALVICPGLLLGVSTGVLLNIALPTWLMTFLLIALLFFLAWRTAVTGLRMRRKERDAQQAQQALWTAGRQEVQQPVKPARQRAARKLQLELSSDPAHEQQLHHTTATPSPKQLVTSGTQAEWQIAAAAADGGSEPAAAAAAPIAEEPGTPLKMQAGPVALGSTPGTPAPGQARLLTEHSTPAAAHVHAAIAEGAGQPVCVPSLSLEQHSSSSSTSTSSAGGGAGPPLSGRALVPASPAPADLVAAASSRMAAPIGSPASSSRPVSQAGSASCEGSNVGDSCSASENSSDDDDAGGLATRQPSWLSAPVLLDGVLDPASNRSSPAPSQWGLLGSAVDSARVRPPRSRRRRRSQRRQHCTIGPGGAADEQSLAVPSEPSAQQEQAAAASQLDHNSVGLLQAEGSGALQAPRPPFPWSKLAQIAALWLLFSGLQLSKERFSRCSWPFALLYACQAAAALSLALLFSWRAGGAAAVRRRRRELDSKQPILQGNIDSSSPAAAAAASAGPTDGSVAVAVAAPSPKQGAAADAWTPRQLAIAFTVALCGGAVAGTLGIGGGMVLAPLLLELGVHPQAASATSGLLVLFSASTAVLAFAAAGRLNLQYAAVFGSACFLSAALGTFLIGRAVRRSGRASLLVLILAGIIAAGAVVTTAFSGVRAVGDLASGTHLGGGSFCG